MRIPLLLACLLVAPVAAQTVETTINLSGLGWGHLDVPQSIETDGDFDTREWLIRSWDTNLWRVVAQRDGQLCAGPWFEGAAHPFAYAEVQRVGRVHKLMVEVFGTSEVRVISLDTPRC